MCYNIVSRLKSTLDRARELGLTEKEISEIEKLLASLLEKTKKDRSYNQNGFEHRPLIIRTNDDLHPWKACTWGLIPHWCKDWKQADQLRKQCLNARGETIFEKPAFRESAKNKRCVINVEGFFEYHHIKGKTYPYFIERKDEKLIHFAGLWSEWADPETGEVHQTYTIVTTSGNEMLKTIHNNPKASGPRMPVILEQDDIDAWLTLSDKEEVKALIRPFPDGLLKARTVRPLRGKESVGDVPEQIEAFAYPELEGKEKY